MRWTVATSVSGFTLAFAGLAALTLVSYEMGVRAEAAGKQRDILRARIFAEELLLSTVTDAESGQRGYLLTGKKRYLEPYRTAVDALGERLTKLEVLFTGAGKDSHQWQQLRSLVAGKMKELSATVHLYDGGQAIDALAMLRTDEGQARMDGVRAAIKVLRDADEAALAQQLQAFDAASKRSTLVLIAGDVCTMLILMGAFTHLMWEHKRRARAEKNALLAMREAQAASQVRTQFLANMSHEIRTPLNAIIGMNDLLLDTSLDTGQHEFARIARDAGTALLQIINHILDFSKIDAGKIELERVPFSITGTVEAQAELMAMRAADQHVALLTFVDPSFPQTFFGDPARIGQVLLNLVNNAVKFTPEGGTVLIRAVPARHDTLDDNQMWVRLEVVDTGPGIAPEAQERLFLPFSQADASTSRRYGGTGLGLAIARSLVELMGGHIGCDSQLGHGTTFWFELPLERDPIATPAVAGDTLAALRRLRVLIVDDDAQARLILSSYLHAWGVQSDAVPNVGTALEELAVARKEGQPFHVAFVDMVMPERQGIDVAKAVRESPRELGSPHLVLITGFDRGNLRQTSLAAGFAAFLTKPVKQSQLLECLLAFLKGEAPKVASADAAMVPEQVGDTSRCRILVAEDSTLNQLVLTKQLETLGYAAHVVANGKEAVEALSRVHYDLVLMDCQMPEMDGYEATQKIRAGESQHHTGQIPIIALTANAQQEDERRCLEAGMTAYLTKPIQREPLRNALKRWLK